MLVTAQEHRIAPYPSVVSSRLRRTVSERRLVLVLGAVVFTDTVFYAAIAPLLPTLVHELHMSKASAGLMTAMYPIGTFVGSIPGGWLTVRIGPRRTVYAGLSLLAVSTLAFGWLDSVAALDAARFVEGVGGAFSWAGALAWLVADVPAERRGQTIGGALGAAIAGSLFGPVIGTIASAVGRGPTFSVVVVLALALMDQCRRLPLVHTPSAQRLRDLVVVFRDRDVRSAMWLVVLPALVSGVVSVLGPLRLHRLGADAAAIGAVYLVAAAIEALLTPAVGWLSDRRGRLLPMRAGLAGTAAALACFTLPSSAVLLGVLIILIAAILSAFWAPAMAMLSEAAEVGGLEHGYSAALMNIAWATGQTLGAASGGVIAKALGDAAPMGVAAGLAVATLVLVGLRPPARARATQEASPVTDPQIP
jgi:predicted MFS family arabinose efflux permease